MNFPSLVILQHIWFGISLFLLLVLLISRSSRFQTAMNTKHFSNFNTVLLIIIFTIVGICGTHWNIYAGEGIGNFRAVGVMIGGFMGGPVVGTITGLIVGLYRAIFFPTEYAYIHGGLTVLQGIAAGFLSYRLKGHHFQVWKWSLYYAFLLEILFWAFFILLTWPYTLYHFNDFLILCLPVLLTNPFGVSIFFALMAAIERHNDLNNSALTASNFEAVNTLITILQKGMAEENIEKILSLITSTLPSLIWAALIYKGHVYVHTSYRDDSDKNQGDAEIAILQLQKELPPMSHIRILPLMVKGEKVGEIYATKAKGFTFTSFGETLLTGVQRIFESIAVYDRMKNEENLLATAEIKALQAQINPHFLFNTLNTIAYYVRSDPDTARKLIQYLSDYFRHSLNNPNQFIPLSEEIHIIDCYTSLEKARFGDRLQITYHFPEKDVEHLMIPPLLLQPLVENAVIHGILKKDEGGRIDIGLIPHKGYNKIYVMDTGVGMAPQKLSHLLDPHQKRDQIGLINVNERLISLFGTEARLHIASRPGKGTLVYAKVPSRMDVLEEKEASRGTD